jgi:hypothetical protein
MAFFNAPTAPVKQDEPITEAIILGWYDIIRKKIVGLSESTTIPTVFEEGKKLLVKMLKSKCDVGDFVMFIKGLRFEIQRRGCYPLSLDSDICFATFKKNDGVPGSTPGKPHYRELNQVCKNTGRKLILVQLECELAKMYVMACRYLGELHPEELEFNEQLQNDNYPDWKELLAHV